MKSDTAYDVLPMISMELERYFYIPLFIYHRLKSSKKTFLFNDAEYFYFFHPYNKTWANERTIEIPLISKLVNQYDPREVLEVGNVLSHYMKTRHVIVDKYEKRKGVLNQDIVDLGEGQKYRFIFSISTIEHIGWDETPRESGKHRIAMKKMVELLQPGGNLLVTIPIGHNTDLDQDIFSGLLIGKVDYFLRISTGIWRQASKDEVVNCRYGSPYKAANALAVLSYICP
jgi:hypothetical protein